MNDSYNLIFCPQPGSGYGGLNTLTGIEWFLRNAVSAVYCGVYVLIPWRALNDSYTADYIRYHAQRLVLIPWRALNDSYKKCWRPIVERRNSVLIPWRALNDSYSSSTFVKFVRKRSLNTLTGIEWFLQYGWWTNGVCRVVVLIPWRALNDSYVHDLAVGQSRSIQVLIPWRALNDSYGEHCTLCAAFGRLS